MYVQEGVSNPAKGAQHHDRTHICFIFSLNDEHMSACSKWSGNEQPKTCEFNVQTSYEVIGKFYIQYGQPKTTIGTGPGTKFWT